MKRILFSLAFSMIAILTWAQYPQVSIYDLQYVDPSDLANCNDSSSYYGDTVVIVGKVVTPGNVTELASSSTAGGYRPFVYLVDTTNNSSPGAFKGLQIMGVVNSSPFNDLDNLNAGDVVKMAVVVDRYYGETQCYPINTNTGSIANGDAMEYVALNQTAPTSVQVSLGDINNSNNVNQLSTGEQWEGSFVELTNVTVVGVYYNSANDRVNFDVIDNNGNMINIYDKFLAQRLSNWQTVNAQSPQSTGSFNPPTSGLVYTSLKGVLGQYASDCNSGEYQLMPFDDSHYTIGVTPPSITSVTRTPSYPTSSETADILAVISDYDGTVTSATLYYSSTPNTSGSYTPVTMTLVSGSTDEFEASIPAFPDGTTVGYYIEATDNDNNTSVNPVTGFTSYTVRDNGPTIVDIQTVFDPANDDASPYVNMEVTVTGVVTASAQDYDLGYVYIQDTSATEYAGIPLYNGTDLWQLKRGDVIEVTGTVNENYGMTRLSVSNYDVLDYCAHVEPVYFDPSDAALYTDEAIEKYEGMLVGLVNPTAGTPIYIDDADAGYGTFTLASSMSASNSTYSTVGRSDNNVFSSLWVSLLADDYYYDNSGQIEVDTVMTQDGMMIDTLIGVMYYSYSQYNVFPRNNDDVIGLADANGNAITLDTTDLSLCEPADTTSVKEILNGVDYNMYPNPAKDQVTLEFNGLSNKMLTVEFFDVAGRSLYTTQVNNQVNNISTTSFENGVYIVRLKDASGNVLSTNRLIINK